MVTAFADRELCSILSMCLHCSLQHGMGIAGKTYRKVRKPSPALDIWFNTDFVYQGSQWFPCQSISVGDTPRFSRGS